MPEEEVSKRVLPDHLTNNLDIIIVSTRLLFFSLLFFSFVSPRSPFRSRFRARHHPRDAHAYHPTILSITSTLSSRTRRIFFPLSSAFLETTESTGFARSSIDHRHLVSLGSRLLRARLLHRHRRNEFSDIVPSASTLSATRPSRVLARTHVSFELAAYRSTIVPITSALLP